MDAQLPNYTCLRRACAGLPAPDDPVWIDLPRMELLESDTGAKPRLATSVDAFWNERALYFRFVAEDDHVVATMTSHDDPIYHEDVVEVFLSETGALETYKEFELSPTNVKFDARIRNDLRGAVEVFPEWHAQGWQTCSFSTDSSWTCVWALPFANFGGAPSPGERWRMNCYRIDRGLDHPDQFLAWSPTGARKFHLPARFGYLHFNAAQGV